MSDFAPVAEDPHVREAESAECGIREHAEKVEPLLEQKVIIIGAGLTGLLIAHGLHQVGISFSVWEAETNSEEQRSGDWSMGIHWALPLLEEILPPELFAKMPECHTDPFHVISDDDFSQPPLMHGVTGEVLKPSSKMKMPRMSRFRTRRWLLEALPEHSVQCGRRLLAIHPGDNTVTAKFDDGTETTGTCLIGADGARSRVRQTLVGVEKGTPSSVPYIATRILMTYPTAEQALHVRSAHYLNVMAFHPDGIWAWISVLDIPDPEAPETWKFQLMTSWRKSEDDEKDSSRAVGLADVKMKYEGFAEPFRSANAWVPDGTPVYANRVTYWEPFPWDNHGGKVSLAGDAAHLMTFRKLHAGLEPRGVRGAYQIAADRGQGLNHAIIDAANYVAALRAVDPGHEDLKDAISRYEMEMIARGREEVRLSKLNTEMVHDWDRLVQSPLFQMGIKRSA